MTGFDHDPQGVYDLGRRDVLAEVEAWLKARRDRFSWAPTFDERADHSWQDLNDALDDLREHVHTGTPLTEPVRQHEEQG